MDSKRQSKLPDGLGKKILQALKTQDEGASDPMQETGLNSHEESGSQAQEFQPAMDEHGLETISHMDFGAQEMQFDQQPLDSEFSELDTTSEVINLDSATDANGAQYGSFMESESNGFEAPAGDPFAQDGFGAPAGDAFAQDSFDQTEFDTPEFQEDPFSPQQEEPTSFEQADYNQQSYDDFDYNQQSYDDFDFSQESYEAVEENFEPETSATEEEMDNYQQPVLGEPPAQPAEQSFEQQYEEPVAQAPEASLNDEFDFSTPVHAQQEQYEEAETQIGYSTEEMVTGESYDQQWQEPTTNEQGGIDLDAIDAQQQAPQEAPQEMERSPLDLDHVEQRHSTEPKMPAPPPVQQMPGPQYEEVHTQQYQEPAAMDERYYQQQPQDMYRQEGFQQEPAYPPQGQYYQEPQRDMYQPPQGQYYQEPQRDMYQPQQGQFYQEPQRDMYQPPQGQFYQEPQRDMYQPQQGQFYQEPQRDLNRLEEKFRQQRIPDPVMPGGERYSSNVETLMRLVANLPNGVPKHTGAQIIRQTMEAMGIPISEVIAEAQQTQGRMLNKTKENYTAIDDHKMQIRHLEESIYMHQRKAKELDDIINLFIAPNQMRMHR